MQDWAPFYDRIKRLEEDMAQLRYKTRWDVSPQGKQKVYFCCHPKDETLYFDRIVKEILEQQDCAVWYKEDMKLSTDEEMFRELEQMQMLVVPVTRRFLMESNEAREKDFAHAIKSHIPVLPVMMEMGLEQIFNEICGEIQFLQKNQIDESEIPYEEKLSQFISSVLVGEEELKKVRAHFQGSIFLSYRKKDRWQAQDLMHAIHSVDFCRDVAIWYDEFLTPGENFNIEIETALKNSSLFVMAVTNNLLGEDNYVLSVEYPMAKSLQKKIMPVLLEDLAVRKLPEKCSDMPQMIQYTYFDKTQLTESLTDALKDLIKSEVIEEEHFYYIGLAYLNGIDVEKNSALGLEMIEKAAGKKYLPAMIKMAELYKEGNGVKRDYYKTLYWREQVLEELEKPLKEGKVPEDAKDYFENLIYHLVNLAEGYKRIYEFEKSKEYFEKIAAYTEAVCKETESFYLGKMHVAACQRIGLWYGDHEELGKAAAWLAKAIEHIIYMIEHGNRIPYQYAMHEMGRICRYQGLLYAKSGELDKAEQSMREGIAHLKKVKLDFHGCVELQNLYIYYIDILIKKERYEEASLLWPECEKLLELQKQENEDKDYLENAARIHSVFAELFFKGKEYEKAEKHCISAYYARKNLWEEDDSYKNQEKLFQTCGALAAILIKENRMREARAYRMQGAYLSLLFYRQRRTEEEKKKFMEYCIYVAQLMRGRTESTDARKIFREYEWTKMIEVEETGAKEAKEDLAAAYFMQTLLAWHDKDDGSVQKKMIQETYHIWKELCSNQEEYETLMQILEKEVPSLLMESDLKKERPVIRGGFEAAEYGTGTYEWDEDSIGQNMDEYIPDIKPLRWLKKLFGKKGEE